MPKAWEDTRVTKKLLAVQPGAIKLARRYGDSLVCVRYRQSTDGLTRYTTIELVVEQATIQKRKKDTDILAVRIAKTELDLRQRVKSHGGRWDYQANVWRLPRGQVKRLGLLDRVV